MDILQEINTIINNIDLEYDCNVDYSVDLNDLRRIGSLVSSLSGATSIRDTHGLINRSTGEENRHTTRNAMIDFDYYSNWKGLRTHPDELEWKLITLGDKINVILCSNIRIADRQASRHLHFMAEMSMLINHFLNNTNNSVNYLDSLHGFMIYNDYEVFQRLFAYQTNKDEIESKLYVLYDYYSKIRDFKRESLSDEEVGVIVTLHNHLIYNLMSNLNLLPQGLSKIIEIKLKIEEFIHSSRYSAAYITEILSNEIVRDRLDRLVKLKGIIEIDQDYKEAIVERNNDVERFILELLDKMVLTIFRDEAGKLENNVQCLSKLFLFKRFTRHHDEFQFTDHIIQDYILNMEKKQHQRISDLKLIKEMIEIIGNGNKEGLISNTCIQIGDRMQRITWNETDRYCIRNEHGVYNKHKKASNRENRASDAARINFEILANLRELKDDADVCKMINETKLSEAIKQDLERLRQKLTHVQQISNLENDLFENTPSCVFDIVIHSRMKKFLIEYIASRDNVKFDLDKEVKTIFGRTVLEHGVVEKLKQKLMDIRKVAKRSCEVGELRLELMENISCYIHDVRTLSKMKEFVQQYRISMNDRMDDIVWRHHNAFILVQVGELSKHISSKLRGVNLLNTFFKLLYEFRKEIKGHPRWISEKADLFLKLNEKFSMISNSVLEVLDALLNMHTGGIDDHKTVNQAHDRLSVFEERHSVLILSVINGASKTREPKIEPKQENKVSNSSHKLCKIAKTFCHFNKDLLKTKFSLKGLIVARNDFYAMDKAGKKQSIREEDIEIETLEELYSSIKDENEMTFEEFLSKQKTKKEEKIIIIDKKSNVDGEVVLDKIEFTVKQFELLEKMERLKEESESSHRFSSYAYKMVLAIAGQCIKELFFDLKFKRYTMKLMRGTEVFGGLSKEIISIRHLIMHARNNNNQNKVRKWNDSIQILSSYSFYLKHHYTKNHERSNMIYNATAKILTLINWKKYKELIKYFEESDVMKVIFNNDKFTGICSHYLQKEICMTYVDALKNEIQESTVESKRLTSFLTRCYDHCKVLRMPVDDVLTLIPSDKNVINYFAENATNEHFLYKYALRYKYLRDNKDELNRFYELNEEIIRKCKENGHATLLLEAYVSKAVYYLRKDSIDEMMDCVRSTILLNSVDSGYKLGRFLSGLKGMIQNELLLRIESGRFNDSKSIGKLKLYENAYEECCKLEESNLQFLMTTDSISMCCQNLCVKARYEIITKGMLSKEFIDEIRDKLEEFEIHFKYYPNARTREIKEFMNSLSICIQFQIHRSEYIRFGLCIIAFILLFSYFFSD